MFFIGCQLEKSSESDYHDIAPLCHVLYSADFTILIELVRLLKLYFSKCERVCRFNK